VELKGGAARTEHSAVRGKQKPNVRCVGSNYLGWIGVIVGSIGGRTVE
jgi:hypothetical protein